MPTEVHANSWYWYGRGCASRAALRAAHFSFGGGLEPFGFCAGFAASLGAGSGAGSEAGSGAGDGLGLGLELGLGAGAGPECLDPQ